jgi:hypothetical protein
MKLSSKRHGRINVFYYRNPIMFHTYTLDGRTIASKLSWMFDHVTACTDLKKSDLRLVASQDGVMMINIQTGGRLFVEKKGRRYHWHEEAPIDISNMHEDYGYNQ